VCRGKPLSGREGKAKTTGTEQRLVAQLALGKPTSHPARRIAEVCSRLPVAFLSKAVGRQLDWARERKPGAEATGVAAVGSRCHTHGASFSSAVPAALWTRVPQWLYRTVVNCGCPAASVLLLDALQEQRDFLSLTLLSAKLSSAASAFGTWWQRLSLWRELLFFCLVATRAASSL